MFDFDDVEQLRRHKDDPELPDELKHLQGCQQDPEWHPEGDAWEHTLLVLKAACSYYRGDDLIRYAALCHDLGKPYATQMINGKWKSPEHDTMGEEPTRRLLRHFSEDFVNKVVCLVVCHMRPLHLVVGDGGNKAYRRLAREVGKSGVSWLSLYHLVRCDYLGRDTKEAKAGKTLVADKFNIRIQEACVEEIQKPEPDVVLGRHLMAIGMKPGPEFGPILAECRSIQYSTDLTDPDAILKIALNEVH